MWILEKTNYTVIFDIIYINTHAHLKPLEGHTNF